MACEEGGGSMLEDESSRMVVGTAQAQVIAAGTEAEITATGKDPAADRAGVDGHAVPQPERDGVAIAQLRHPGAQAIAGKVGTPIRFAVGAEETGLWTFEEIGDGRLIHSVAVMVG